MCGKISNFSTHLPVYIYFFKPVTRDTQNKLFFDFWMLEKYNFLTFCNKIILTKDTSNCISNQERTYFSNFYVLRCARMPKTSISCITKSDFIIKIVKFINMFETYELKWSLCSLFYKNQFGRYILAATC